MRCSSYLWPARITFVGSTRRLWIINGALLLGLVAIVATLPASSDTPSSKPTNDFRFSILGDRTGDAEPQVYERVWRDVGLLHPDFVVNVGDTIQGGNDATADAEWKALQPLWDRYKLP